MGRRSQPDELLAIIGAAVAKRRMELSLSQEDLAEKAGVHRTYVSDIERGVRNVSILTLERIAEALDIALAVLLMAPTTTNHVRVNNNRRKI